jgi:hypothetical protein
MALSERQARELRSLMQGWNRTSQGVGEMLRGAAVTREGLDMEVLRQAIDQRAQAEQLVVSFWSSVMSEEESRL